MKHIGIEIGAAGPNYGSQFSVHTRSSEFPAIGQWRKDTREGNTFRDVDDTFGTIVETKL